MRRQISLLAGALVVCLSALALIPRAAAFTTEGAVWANSTATVYYVLPTGSLDLSTAVNSAMQEWNNQSGFTFVPVAASADPCDSTQPVGVSLSATMCGGDAFGSTTLAVTFYDPGAGQFKHAGTVFNSSKTFAVYDGPLLTSAIDFRRVAAHEMGHVLGLDEDNSGIASIMAPSVSDVDRPTAEDLAGLQSLYGTVSNQTAMVAAVLPSSRSVLVNGSATAFASMVNTSATPATGCSVALATPIAAAFSFQTTSAANNTPVGAPNMLVDIPGNGTQTYSLQVTPTAPVSATDVGFTFKCANAQAASNISGVNTLLLSASTTPTPDIVALTATSQNDGYVHISNGAGAFAVATVNLGAGGTITASGDTGNNVITVTIGLCQTNPATGQCITPIASSVPNVVIDAKATPTFAVFVTSPLTITSNPATKRIFVRFQDSAGVTRGSTSVAVTTQ